MAFPRRGILCWNTHRQPTNRLFVSALWGKAWHMHRRLTRQMSTCWWCSMLNRWLRDTIQCSRQCSVFFNTHKQYTTQEHSLTYLKINELIQEEQAKSFRNEARSSVRKPLKQLNDEQTGFWCSHDTMENTLTKSGHLSENKLICLSWEYVHIVVEMLLFIYQNIHKQIVDGKKKRVRKQ